MREDDKDKRKLVLDVLSGIQVSGAGEIYAAALGDNDPNVVITAVENLGRTRTEEFRGQIEELLQAGSHPMLVGACLEALVGIGHQSSLAGHPPEVPGIGDAAGLLSGVMLESDCRPRISQGVRGSGEPVTRPRLLTCVPRCWVRSSRFIPAARRWNPARICSRFCERWLKMAIHRSAAIRRCGFWGFGQS